MSFDSDITAIKELEYNFFLASLFIPYNLRHKLWIALSFCLELESIPLKAKEELLIMIRYAWWREQIEQANTTASPLIESICRIIADKEDLRNRFLSVIDKYENKKDDIQLIKEKLLEDIMMSDSKICKKFFRIYLKLKSLDINQSHATKLRKVFAALWAYFANL